MTELRVAVHEPLLGTRVDIAIGPTPGLSSRQADRSTEAAHELALRQIAHLTTVLSVFDPGSELCRWRTGDHELPSPELAAVLAEAERWHRLGSGALHPAGGRLRDRWQQAERDGEPPAPEELQAIADAVRPLPYRVRHHDGATTVERLGDCSQVDLNALAKGYIVDRAVTAALAVDGVDTVIVNAGGDLRHAGEGEVPVRIEDPAHPADNAAPLTRITLARGAVATSGSARRGWRIGGRHHGHVLDPRTGQPVSHTVSATVRAATAMTADAVATVAMVLPPREAVDFVDRIASAATDDDTLAALLVQPDGTVWCSRRGLSR